MRIEISHVCLWLFRMYVNLWRRPDTRKLHVCFSFCLYIFVFIWNCVRHFCCGFVDKCRGLAVHWLFLLICVFSFCKVIGTSYRHFFTTLREILKQQRSWEKRRTMFLPNKNFVKNSDFVTNRHMKQKDFTDKLQIWWQKFSI